MSIQLINEGGQREVFNAAPIGFDSGIPKDVGRIVLAKLNFWSLVNLASINRWWNQLVKVWIITSFQLPGDERSTPYRRVLDLVQTLQQTMFADLGRLDAEFDFRSLFQTSNLLGIRLRDSINYLYSFPNAVSTIDSGERLAKVILEEMPGINLSPPICDGLIEKNLESSHAMFKAVIEKANEFEEWSQLHQDLLNARAILVVWESLVLAVPEEHREFLEGPGMANLTSPREVIEKAKEFPAWFNGFRKELTEHVTELNIYGEQLRSVPKEIFELTRLRILDLQHNQFTSLSKGIGKLRALRTLCLSHNKLTLIPDELFELNELRGLSIDNNKISSISNRISALTQLMFLYLHNNQLSSIPDEVARLPNLIHLECQNNQITSIPWRLSILRLHNLGSLFLNANPLDLKSRMILSSSNFIWNNSQLLEYIATGLVVAAVGARYFWLYLN